MILLHFGSVVNMLEILREEDGGGQYLSKDLQGPDLNWVIRKQTISIAQNTNLMVSLASTATMRKAVYIR
ncbi:hypothetical protein CVT26_008236 [Gymnopilus dilepis]|uniref:Uncharacterized protein n=1 Tax=Gymnopilus dilepis TaxID=231916 RepID=A0A409XXE6_9AGAR|nr:hypothetical protein CVT26_008236 [Gymnopilus dilepis]